MPNRNQWLNSQFETPKTKFKFCILVLSIFIAPVVFDLFGFSLNNILSHPNNLNGAYHFNKNLIYREKGDVDVLFLGSSYIRWQIEGKVFENLLSDKLQRPAAVRLLSFDMRANEQLLILLKEFLRHRKAKFVVLTPNLSKRYSFPHKTFFEMGGYPSSAVAGLTVGEHWKLYVQSLRGLLFKIRSMVVGHSSISKLLGGERNGTRPTPPERLDLKYPERRFDGRSMFFDLKRKSDLKIVDYSLENHEIVYFKQILQTLKANEIPFVILLPPSEVVHRSEADQDQVTMEGDLFQNFGEDLNFVGIPYKNLMEGIPKENQRQHLNGVHLNTAGATWFTQNIFPGLYYAYKNAQLD